MPARGGAGDARRQQGSRPLARAAASGVLWQGLSLLLGKSLTLVATVVLARLLAPEAFGLVGLALVFVVFAEYASDLGVAQALVYLSPDRRNDDAAVALSVASGLALLAAGLLAAPAIADFFGRDEVAAMVRLTSVALLLSALRQVPDALLRRDLLFRRRMLSEVSRTVLQGAVSIVLSVAGAGAWWVVWGL